MKKYRVCVVESRDYIVIVEAEDESEAEELAKLDYEEHSVSDMFRECIVD